MLIKLGCGGVDVSSLDLSMRKVLRVVELVFAQEPVITSTWEGTHSAGSFHQFKRALDFRKPFNTDGIVDRLKEELGPDYDVIMEGDHIHIEHDPK